MIYDAIRKLPEEPDFKDSDGNMVDWSPLGWSGPVNTGTVDNYCIQCVAGSCHDVDCYNINEFVCQEQ